MIYKEEKKMLPIKYNKEKRQKLLKERDIDLEKVKHILLASKVVDTIDNPNYENQQTFVIIYDWYYCAVPYVEDVDHIFLKTAYLSRKLKKLYS